MRNIPMNLHTTFKTGGIADYFAVPESYNDISILLKFTKMHSVPVFILGGGANILVSDNGIRGLVIDMSKISKFGFKEDICFAEAGFPISDLSKAAAEKNLSGLDFIYGMPGSVGGAVWMNARCYDVSVSDILLNIDYLDENFEIKTLDGVDIRKKFSYKFSPFQNSNCVILSASFLLKKDNKDNIWNNMKLHKQDRENKGHYKYPSAGSVFKNNRDFGKPTGTIIDSIGLKGYSRGDAEIASFHGNIIVNKKQARSQDIRNIINYTQNKVNEKLGLKLEAEIQFIGDWGKNEYMD